MTVELVKKLMRQAKRVTQLDCEIQKEIEISLNRAKYLKNFLRIRTKKIAELESLVEFIIQGKLDAALVEVYKDEQVKELKKRIKQLTPNRWQKIKDQNNGN